MNTTKRTTRVLMEGTLTYWRRFPAAVGAQRAQARVFILDWFEGGRYGGTLGEGQITNAVVVFREEAWLGERLDPIPVGSIREVEASGPHGTLLVADVS